MIQVPNAYKEKNIVYIFTIHCFIKQKNDTSYYDVFAI